MITKQTVEEWNDGTIYRIQVQSAGDFTSNIITVPVDIAQSELVGKVFIGLESLCLDRELYTNTNTPLLDLGQQNAGLKNSWANIQYLQLRSVSMPPDIDYTTQAQDVNTGRAAYGRNTQVFTRVALPLDIVRSSTGAGNEEFYLNPRVVVNNNLNKDGILTEMTNNPNALANGQLHIQLINTNGNPLNLQFNPIRNLQFVIVIYKPRNTYN